MKTKSFLLLFLCLFLITACSEDEVEPGFSFETAKEVTIASAVDSKTTITFTSSREWQARSSADWVTVSPSSGGAGTAVITVKANSENRTGDSRTATLTLTSGSVQEEITLQQETADYIKPEQDVYEVPVEGGKLKVVFATNMESGDFEIYSSGDADWLSQDAQTRAVNNYAIELNVAANPTKKPRTATLYFVKDNTGSITYATVEIVQGVGSSTDYSKDKGVRELQKAKIGNGIPIVIMGDGFIDEEINDGTYEKVMDKAYENLFSEEPIKSLRDYFDVYAVTAVSKNNAFGKGYETVFSCELEGGGSTGISGDDEAIQKYAGYVKGIDLLETLAVVILNTSVHAGTTYYYSNSTTGKAIDFAIAYCPVIIELDSENFRQVLTHEAVGHGFGKLGDEYYYEESGTIPAEEIENLRLVQSDGWMLNVDVTADPTKVIWSTFLTDSRYASEGLGVFEGAYTYMKGAYRPSDDSMMGSNTRSFNAPSRKVIYDRIMKKGVGVTPTYEEFVTFDLQHKPAQTRSITSTYVPGKPFARPRIIKKEFKN